LILFPVDVFARLFFNQISSSIRCTRGSDAPYLALAASNRSVKDAGVGLATTVCLLFTVLGELEETVLDLVSTEVQFTLGVLTILVFLTLLDVAGAATLALLFSYSSVFLTASLPVYFLPYSSVYEALPHVTCHSPPFRLFQLDVRIYVGSFVGTVAVTVIGAAFFSAAIAA
jgi:hypothetical protein